MTCWGSVSGSFIWVWGFRAWPSIWGPNDSFLPLLLRCTVSGPCTLSQGCVPSREGQEKTCSVEAETRCDSCLSPARSPGEATRFPGPDLPKRCTGNRRPPLLPRAPRAVARTEGSNLVGSPAHGKPEKRFPAMNGETKKGQTRLKHLF